MALFGLAMFSNQITQNKLICLLFKCSHPDQVKECRIMRIMMAAISGLHNVGGIETFRLESLAPIRTLPFL
jgi:cAMP phosphodiesterase